MTDVDLAKIKRNVATMVQKGAPEDHIDQYISQSGTNIDAVKSFNPPPLKSSTGFPIQASPMPPRKTGESDANYFKRTTYAGNMVTGAEQSGVDIMRVGRWLGEKLYGKNPHDEAEKAAFDAADKKLESQKGSGVGNAIARFSGDPLNYVGGAAIKEAKAVPKLMNAAEKMSAARKEKFVQDFVLPKQTKKVKEAQVDRVTEKGFRQKKVYDPTPREKEMAAEVGKLPVKKYYSEQKNYNIIKDANIKEAERLKAEVKKANIPVSGKTVEGIRQKAIQEALKDPYVASHRVAAKTVVDQFNKVFTDLAKKNGGKITLSDALQARKNFDKSVKGLKKNAFDTDITNSTSAMAKHLRDGLNDFIEKNLPTESAKASFKRQSLLYDAMKNIKPKAAAAPSSLPKRIMAHPAAKPVGRIAGAAALGAGGYGGYKLGKDIFSP